MMNLAGAHKRRAAITWDTVAMEAIEATTTRLHANGYATVLASGVCVRCALRFANVQDSAVYACV